MCGIFGYIGSTPKAQTELVDTLGRLLQHRGPNDWGFESGAGWGLGFRRLSILDLSESGHQPMNTPDGRFWIIFNGEIYNYIELRAELEQAGEKFRSTSDTEVLLRLLAREGAKGLSRLNGMFALALVDTQQRTFLLARDRVGKKPLYYQVRPDQFRFASELKGLLAWPDATSEINPPAITQYLALGYLPKDECIFKGYQKLPPGHYLFGTFDEPDRIQQKPYWQLEIKGEEGQASLTDRQLEELLDLLADATRIRLRSDVPVGIFLSGGIDSGLVAALAAQSPASNQLLALTVSFKEQDYDETALARMTAEHVGLEHCLIQQKPAGLAAVDRIAWFFDEPFGDSSAIPTYTLCEAAAKYAIVFIAGDGGDEGFGGYLKYCSMLRQRLRRVLPASAVTAIETVSKLLPELSELRYRIARKSVPFGGFGAAFNRAPIDPVFKLILSSDLRPLAHRAGEPLWEAWQQYQSPSVTARQQWLDYASYLPNDILVKVDRASMAHSLELRSPFLDHRVVEWAARLPRSILLNTRRGKLPLRALAGSLLPPAIQNGVKRGFGTPLDTWFRRPAGQALARERLLSNRACQRGLWDRRGVERLITAHHQGRGRDFGEWLWRLLVLDAWARHYWDSRDFLQGPPAVEQAALD